jgi:hypothetical protein
MESLKRVQVSSQNPQQLGSCRSQGQAILSALFPRIRPLQAYRNTPNWLRKTFRYVESSWNVMVHGDAWEGKWRGNWRMECVASTLRNTSEHGVSSITTADAHISAASSLMNCRPRRFKWTCPFRRKTKSGFCVCDITFQTQSTKKHAISRVFSFGRAWLPRDPPVHSRYGVAGEWVPFFATTVLSSSVCELNLRHFNKKHF